MLKKTIFLCFMIIMVVPFLLGCKNTQPHENDAEGIDPSVALKLREDYLEQLHLEYPNMEVTLGDIWIQEYYGTYSGCEVIFMGSPLNYTDAHRSIVVAGYIITFGSSQKLYVHKDSHFYTVNEAYDAGYITKEDIEGFGPEVDVNFREWKGEAFSSEGFQIVTIPPT